MASSDEDKNFKCSFDNSRGKSKAQMSVTKILDTISTTSAASVVVVAPPSSQPKQEGEETFVVKKRALLDIDLNVAPPEESDFDSPAAENGGNGETFLPAAVEENKVGCAVDGSEMNFKNGIQAHSSKTELNGLNVYENEVKAVDDDSELEREEKENRNQGWDFLLEVAANALHEHEKNQREKIQNQKRKPSREAELGGELHRGTTRRKIGWSDDNDVAAAVVVRSTRGRAVAMPNKYKDSVLDAVAVAELPRRGKSATVVSTKRKSR